MEVSLDTLVEALDQAKEKEKKRKKRAVGETKTYGHVERFISDYNIRDGVDRIPTYVIFYKYKRLWEGIHKGKKLNRIVFFRSFNKYNFKTTRTGKQRYYLLDGSSFDLTREGILEAKQHDKEYKIRSKARKESHRKAQKLKKESKSKI